MLLGRSQRRDGGRRPLPLEPQYIRSSSLHPHIGNHKIPTHPPPVYRVIGKDFTHSFFTAARADPTAKLYYNEFNIECCCNAKINAQLGRTCCAPCSTRAPPSTASACRATRAWASRRRSGR
ncbi:hypothetical protein B0I37DRAFT_381749 [Chaetomium sp. MPI-CAGE-AT-0009]|nr:hypothetical protein B0I37DRAFT_381749 [Chaetomium sp. MPI-CAGE-AT-0009]